MMLRALKLFVAKPLRLTVYENYEYIMMRFLVTLTVIMALPVAAAAQALKADSSKQITIVSGPTPPYYGRALPDFGHYASVIRAAFEQSDYQVSFHEENWSRVFQDTEASRYDVAANAWFNEDRAKRFIFSKPYAQNRVLFLKHKDNPIISRDLDQAEKYRLAIVRGSVIARDFPFQIFHVNDDIAVARMVLRRRVDLGALEENTAAILLPKYFPNDHEKFAFLEKPAGAHQSHIIISKSHENGAEILAAFDRGLNTIMKNGTYGRLLKEADLEKAMVSLGP